MVTARYLGAAGFGILSFGIAFTWMFGTFADLGVRKVVIRDLARDPSMIRGYFGKIFAVKLILIMIVLPLIVLTINLLNYPEITKRVVYILCIAMVVGSSSDLFYAFFQSQETMGYESLGQVVRATILLAGALFGMKMKFGLLYFASIYCLSNTVILVYCFTIYIRRFAISRIRVDKGFMGRKIKEALPFGLIGVFEIIYHWMDTVMLSLMKGDTVVGWYNVAYRLFLVTLFIPSVFNIAIYPVMSRYYVSSKDALKSVYLKYFKYLTIIGILIVVGITIFADKIILLVFGSEYEPSIVALRILIWSSLCIFINGAFVRLFESINKQVLITKVCGCAALLNVFLNLLLIPRYSYVGASFATVVSELVITVSLIMFSSSTPYKIEYSTIMSHLYKISVVGLLLGICIYYCRNFIPLLLILPIMCLSYFVMIFLIKGFDREDLAMLKMLYKRV